MKNPVPKKGTMKLINGKPYYYIGRSSYGSKADSVRGDLAVKGIGTKIAFDKYLGYFIWATKPVKVELTEARLAYNPDMKMALGMRARYREDMKSGHSDAAEYWRGQASACFTGNPEKCYICLKPFTPKLRKPRLVLWGNKVIKVCEPCAKEGQFRSYQANLTDNPSICYLCHRNFTAKRRRPIRALKGKNPVLVCGECARKIVRANPSLTETKKRTISEYRIEPKLLLPSRTIKKPTKAQLRKWSKMPSLFSNVTEKDREEAWKRGCII